MVLTVEMYVDMRFDLQNNLKVSINNKNSLTFNKYKQLELVYPEFPYSNDGWFMKPHTYNNNKTKKKNRFFKTYYISVIPNYNFFMESSKTDQVKESKE